jgi:hypothetical protein
MSTRLPLTSLGALVIHAAVLNVNRIDDLSRHGAHGEELALEFSTVSLARCAAGKRRTRVAR